MAEKSVGSRRLGAMVSNFTPLTLILLRIPREAPSNQQDEDKNQEQEREMRETLPVDLA